MAESDTADSSKNVIKVEEEIEGDQIGTKNYRFSKIGESVPIKSDADFKFDMESLPARPMAVSERFGVIFVAHSSGFCVARTKDVIDTAEELKNGGNGSCIQELSVVDVSLGKVSILALSADSSMLAASVGSNLYFFSVEGLLNKDQEPSFSKSLNGSSSIKEMQWSPRLKDQYVVLTNDGNLYHAAGQDDLNNLMDNVDAVSWSMNGKFLAVAKHDCLSVLSSKFEEKLRIKLLFDSLVDDFDADSVVKVDSVKWVRPDCIMLGCYRLNADGKEENYLLELISVKDGKITSPSSNPVALTFSDAFLAMNEDDIPSGSGPHMFVCYLDECEIAFVANRKSTDQRIVLIGWSSDKNNEAEMIEITNDAWVPTIKLQDNNDDNLIVGLAVDKVYKDEKLRLTLGEEDTEVSPCCILMCLTIDAKLFMFHLARSSRDEVPTLGRRRRPSDPPQQQVQRPAEQMALFGAYLDDIQHHLRHCELQQEWDHRHSMGVAQPDPYPAPFRAYPLWAERTLDPAQGRRRRPTDTPQLQVQRLVGQMALSGAYLDDIHHLLRHLELGQEWVHHHSMGVAQPDPYPAPFRAYPLSERPLDPSDKSGPSGVTAGDDEETEVYPSTESDDGEVEDSFIYVRRRRQ